MADTRISVTITADSGNAEAAISRLKASISGLPQTATNISKRVGETLSGGMQTAMKGTTAVVNGLKSAMSGTKNVVLGVVRACGPLGAAVATAFAVEKVVQFSATIAKTADSLSMMKARLGLIADGMRTSGELLAKIHSAANSSKADFQEMASTVSKLSLLAKDAFSSNDEAIFFAQQLNKQFKIGGASIQEQTAGMYQLTQAMAAGRLQGDEFRSIMENAPLLAQSIANEMGVTVGKLREMSSEGMITADVIKNAMLSSAEETNQRFNALPTTFADVGLRLGNDFINAFEPVLAQISSITANSNFQTLIDGISQSFTVMANVSLMAIDGMVMAVDLLSGSLQFLYDVGQSGYSLIAGTGDALVILVPILSSIVTYNALVSASFVTTGNDALISGTKQVAAYAKSAAAQAISTAKTVAHNTAMIASKVATEGLAVAQALLSAQTYKNIAAQTASIAKMTAQRAVTLTTAAAAATLKAVQLAWNAAQVAGLIVLGTYNAALAVNAAKLGVTKVATLASSAATAVMTGTMKVLNMVIRANPIGLLITALVALGTAFAGSEIAANGFKETLSTVFNKIVHTIAWGVNKAIDLINLLIKGLNWVGDKVGKLFGTEFKVMPEISNIDPQAVEDFANKAKEVAGNVVGAIFNPGGDIDIGSADAGGGGGGAADAAGSGGRAGQAAERAKKAAEDAKQIHESIEKEWLDMFATRDKLVDKWYQEERQKLEESKGQNANYTEDLTRLNEIYSKKRLDALREEANAIREVNNLVRDLAVEMNEMTTLKGLEGSAKLFADLSNEADKAINSINDRFDELEDKFASWNARQKQAFIDSLKASGQSYTLSDDGNSISLAEQRAAQIVAVHQDMQRQINDIRQQGKDFMADLDIAMTNQHIESFRTMLESEEFERVQSYERQKEYMNEYLEAVKAAHMDAQDVMKNTSLAAIDSLEESISGILQGTTSLVTAFQNLGKAVVKSLADMAAQFIAAQLKQALFGKLMMTQQTAMATAATPAWAELAKQMAMATWGASATTGMAAYVAANSMGSLASGGGIGGKLSGSAVTDFTSANTSSLIRGGGMRFMASGGYAYGPTIAMIGEGNYPEAVLPLNENVYSEIGQGIAKSEGGGGNVTLHINAMDADSFASWLGARGGQVIKQYLYDGNREFTADTGVW